MTAVILTINEKIAMKPYSYSDKMNNENKRFSPENPLVFFSLLAFFVLSTATFASDSLTDSTTQESALPGQLTAQYTHLKWDSQVENKIPVRLIPIKNFSGIPFEDRNEKADYYYHGKIPESVNLIAADLLLASRHFDVNQQTPDYTFEFTLDRYKLPFKYAPDDIWWQDLHDQTDRWLQSPGDSIVKLTLNISSKNKSIPSWSESTEMRLSNCYLNRFPQPSTFNQNSNTRIRKYLTTTPGQAFVAATNYLIMNAIEKLNQTQFIGQVERKLGQDIIITRNKGNFTMGEILNVYFNHAKTGVSRYSAGTIKIIQTMGRQAIAYPVNLRADHITINDKVGIKAMKISRPDYHFQPVNQCEEQLASR